MSIRGPILYIEDDNDDQMLVQMALKEIDCQNELLMFNNGMQAIDYLRTTKDKPFLILCNLRLPGMSGLELKDFLNQDLELKKKSIPFVFLSGIVNPVDVETAYLQLVQGFYKKEKIFEELKDQLKAILEYWYKAIHPTTQL